MTPPHESDSSPTPPPGRTYEVLPNDTKLGAYSITGCIAYGILGTLYSVRTTKDENSSLFVLPRLLGEDDGFLAHFRDFKSKQARLRHPNILSTPDSILIGDRICLPCDETPGASIPDILGAAGIYPSPGNPGGVTRAQPSEAAKDFTPEVVGRVAMQTLQALDCAHSLGVLHLSLTPSSIIMSDAGDIRVLGFGLFGSMGTQAVEMLISAGIPPVSLGPRNVRLSIADILSPEVHLNREPDARSDIYAFGMCAYWMLTGLKACANYRPPSGIVPGLDPGWDVFLAKCLAREPANRHPNARAALRDLENISGLSRIGYADELAKTISGKKISSPKRRRSPLFIAAPALIALAAGGFYFWQNPDAVGLSPVIKTGTVVITTRPGSGVALLAPDGKKSPLGVADANGVITVTLAPGTHTLTIDIKDGESAPLKDIVVTAGSAVARSVFPEVSPGEISFTGTPDGVSVTLDGIAAGVTPLVLKNLPAGKLLKLVLSKENFRDIPWTVTLGSGEKRVITPGPMERICGAANFTITFSGAAPTPERLAALKVARNDKNMTPVAWADAFADAGRLPIGDYLVEFAHPDYATFRTTFAVRDRAATPVAVNLRANPAPFRLEISPSGLETELKINGQIVPRAPEEIPAETPLEITVSAPDRLDYTRTVNAKPGKPFTLHATLGKIPPPEFGKSFVCPGLGVKLVWIPAGEAALGTPKDEPGHTAVEEPTTFASFTRGFWMARTETTQSEYRRILDRTPSEIEGDSLPVTNVSHSDAARYCRTLTRREFDADRLPAGWEYRLPTEIEWAYACRSGGGDAYAFGPVFIPQKANLAGDRPKPVGSYPESKYGVSDLHGNVREWLLEPYRPHLPGGRRIDFIPTERELAGEIFLSKGGSWKTPAVEGRTGYRPRSGEQSSTIANDLGFRIVLAPSPRP